MESTLSAILLKRRTCLSQRLWARAKLFHQRLRNKVRCPVRSATTGTVPLSQPCMRSYRVGDPSPSVASKKTPRSMSGTGRVLVTRREPPSVPFDVVRHRSKPQRRRRRWSSAPPPPASPSTTTATPRPSSATGARAVFAAAPPRSCGMIRTGSSRRPGA
ncbi:l-ascorbate oxidase-like protein [Hordeum vulgare]|nr:l-ascorbate oxidase-like protein [Hordeum vulgare]